MKININQEELKQTIKLQQEASDPKRSVFVAASAGSGKTKILTDRVLRLLLTGSTPNQILCLTFTKVAAFEMKHRIYKELGNWSIINENDLSNRIFNLTAQKPSKSLLKKARNLFVSILDDFEGIKINTIHAFCQGLMARFPLESEIKPNFSIIDSQIENKLLLQAKDMLLKEALTNESLKQKIQSISSNLNEEGFLDIILELINKRSDLESTIEELSGLNNLNNILLLIFNSKDKDKEIIYNLINNPDQDSNFNVKSLKEIANIAKDSDKISDKNYYNSTINYLKNPNEDNFAEYINGFFTQKKEARKNIITKFVSIKYENASQIIKLESDRLASIIEEINSFYIANLTIDLLEIANKMLQFYSNLKNSNNYLDYSDLISKSVKLLNNKENSQWIKYKLDGAIEHILVDESQDTNNNQWQIIKAVSDDFFNENKTEEGQKRTIFIVGDNKQSIYSFQGADPGIFSNVFSYYQNKLKLANQEISNISLNNSFRSRRNILKLVDNIFQNEKYKKAISPINMVKHNPIKIQENGKVELWPIINVKKKKEEYKNDFSWKINVRPSNTLNSKELLAKLIAKKIKSWIVTKKIIKSENRVIQPRDIMILIKNRTNNLGNLIIENLQKEGIAVNGGDKIELFNNILIKDLLTIARFLLLPEDDLNLATLLKSPLLEISEEDLFELCQVKNQKEIYLFQALKLSKKPNIIKALEFLSDMENFYQRNTYEIYLLFLHILENKNKKAKIIAHFGEESKEIIHQFLNLCINFEESDSIGLESFISDIDNSSLRINIDSINNEFNQVKITTIHSAKGLESKIIILADSFHSHIQKYGSNKNKILWLNKDNLKIPIYKASKDSQLTNDIKKHNLKIKEEEYLRLLYVAITRAEEEIYITGFGENATDDCWYNLIKNYGLIEAKTKESDFRNLLNIKEDDFTQNNEILYFEDENQNTTNEITLKDNQENNQNYKIPDFLTKKAETELFQNIIYPSTIDKTSYNNITQANNVNFGNIIHKILELFIKKLKNNNILLKIEKHLNQHYKELESAEKKEILRQIKILSIDKKFEFLRINKLETEIPIFSNIDNQIISGKIDLLVIKQDEIIIIDYKSNKINKEEINEIAKKYQNQLELYRVIIQEIYPDKKIKSAIIWTYLSEITFL